MQICLFEYRFTSPGLNFVLFQLIYLDLNSNTKTVNVLFRIASLV